MDVFSINRKDKERVGDNTVRNKSMDVRQKQLLSSLACLFVFTLRVGGFSPRHLNRSTTLINGSQIKH